jgi:hypothetical protein
MWLKQRNDERLRRLDREHHHRERLQRAASSLSARFSAFLPA